MEQRRFSGKTVEEATDNALEALDVNLEDVEIVVVNPGRSGILGFGGEPAEIDVALLDGSSPARPVGSHSDTGSDDEYEPETDDQDDYDDGDDSDASDDDDDDFVTEPDSDDQDADDDYQPVAVSAPVAVDNTDDEADHTPEPAAPRERRTGGQRSRTERPERSARPSEPDPEVIEFASEVIDYFLASMNVVADTYIREESDEGVPVFDIEGEDSGLLIGRRGETLQSLQYLVNLIVTHQLGRSAYVQIDIEGYKERRRETLGGVAQRTAERVADSGESAELEPMPAYERRWVHMSLANNTDVTTESSGEGANRFVVIYPAGAKGSSGGDGGRRPRNRGGRRRR